MYSKKTGNFLPVNSRRIQQFIDQVLFKPEAITDGFVCNDDHIFRYFGIFL